MREAFLERARGFAPYLGVEAEGSRFVVATRDRHMGRHLFIKQARPEFRVLGRAVRMVEALKGDDAIAGRLFVDVGANIGTSTVCALGSHRFGSAVCCEPEEENFRLLRANLALNGLDGRTDPLRVGVSDRVGRSNLVVTGGPAGKSRVVLDRRRIEDRKEARVVRRLEDPTLELPEMTVIDLELVTLDRLARTGVIDRERLGMVWIDAEGHEGHILQGAGTLTDRGVPIVFEFHPSGLDAEGSRGMTQEVAEQCYTHFVDVRRQEADQRRFGLRPVTELSRLADHFLDPSIPASYTDVLLLRLDAEQARTGENLPELLVQRRRGGAPGIEGADDGDGPDPFVAFVHIPKTAGATVASMLAAAYSRAALHDAGNYIRDPERTVSKITRRPGGWERWRREGGRVTIGHVPYGLFRQHLPADARYITFLREPVDRVLSHYYRHIHRTGTSRDQWRRDRGLAVTASLEEALEIQLPELNDFATRLLCGDPSPFGELPASALSAAKENLREFAFVGLQERFDESVVLLQRTLGLGLVPYQNRHVSVDRPAADEIGDEQRALVAEANQLDAELYSFAQELFEDAVAASDHGLVADVEKLRAESAELNQEAVRDARDLLDRELPAGTTKPRTALFEVAEAAGVSLAAVKHASTLLSLRKGHDQSGQPIWTRSEEAQAGL